MDKLSGIAFALTLNQTAWYFILRIIGDLLEITMLSTIGNWFGVSAIIFGFIGISRYLIVSEK